MDHVQIIVEEYNKLRDFYVTAENEEFVSVQVFLVGDYYRVVAVKKDELDQAIQEKLSENESTINEYISERALYSGNISDISDKLNKIPRWGRRIFKAL